MGPWNCPTCGWRNATAFCPFCGEARPDERALRLGAILRQIFHGISALDGQLIVSAAMLVRRPGVLTLAFLQGRHRPFTGPFRLFLFANMLFFAMQSFAQVEIFGDSLTALLSFQDWSPLARALVARHLEAEAMTFGHYAPVFDRSVTLNAKSLIVLMVLPFTAMLSLIFLRARRPFGVHLVFALHFYGFLMLVFCALLAIVAMDAAMGGGGMRTLDKPLFFLTLALCAAHLQRATRVAYDVTGARRMIGVAALTVTVGAMMSGYRFLIFLITLYTT